MEAPARAPLARASRHAQGLRGNGGWTAVVADHATRSNRDFFGDFLLWHSSAPRKSTLHLRFLGCLRAVDISYSVDHVVVVIARRVSSSDQTSDFSDRDHSRERAGRAIGA